MGAKVIREPCSQLESISKRSIGYIAVSDRIMLSQVLMEH